MVYSDSITPPPTPPRVAFDPPLFLQRRTAVIDLLHKVHKLPRFNGKLRSLLDVGCGLECMLLGSLIALNDDLPLDQVTGIDLDDGLRDQILVDSLGPNGQHVGDEGRWRKFGLTLLHGTFERLSLPVVKHHDIIVSAEVIEHLDPGPLSNFAPVLLGQLKPRVCIITTPNRDFNDLFSLPFTPEISSTPNPFEPEEKIPSLALGEEVDPENLPPAKALPLPTTTAGEEAWRALSPGDVCSCGDKYWRSGVPYGMRHPDHRFEWTRQEFRDWAYKAAEDFGYDVTFTGVGGLGNGMCVYGTTGWAVGDALARGCGYNTGGDEAPEQRDEGVLTKANEVWGDCTQIAIFTIREDEEEDAEDYIKAMDWSKQHPTDPDSTTTVSSMNPYYFPNPITQIIHHDFPYETDEVFPPTFLTVMELLERELSNYLPNRIREQWGKSTFDIMQEKKNYKKHDHEEFLYESDSECDYGWNPDIDGDEVARQVRKKERRYEKTIRWEVEKAVLGGKSAELIKIVKVTGVSLKTLWEGSVGGKKGLRRFSEMF
ncbi:hypothetical protein BGX38DRAFT_689595 [Terfezia claveryi]|nr:hypothetical protein BGX38DRAFT_689595 [Terfezia claveryi]